MSEVRVRAHPTQQQQAVSYEIDYDGDKLVRIGKNNCVVQVEK